MASKYRDFYATRGQSRLKPALTDQNSQK